MKHFRFSLVLMLFFQMAAEVLAQSITTQSPLELKLKINLNNAPVAIAFSPTDPNLLAVATRGKQLVFINIENGEKQSLDLLGEGQTLAFSKDGDYLLVVGTDGIRGLLSRVSVTSKVITSATLDFSPTQPSLAVSTSGDIFLGDANMAGILKVRLREFDRTGDLLLSINREKSNQIPIPFLGVRGIYVDGENSRIFVVASGEATLAAINMSSFREIDRFQLEKGIAGKSGAKAPFALTAGRLKGAQDGTTTLLVGDYETETLSLLDFDPKFQAFSVIARNRFDQSPSTRGQAAPEFNPEEQPTLLAASMDQSTILVGNRLSSELVQLAVTGEGKGGLERVTKLELFGFPISSAVNSIGKSAAVAVQKRSEYSVLVFSGMVVNDANPTNANRRTLEIKKVQATLNAIGYDVGIVDGVTGKSTLTAIENFRKKSGSEFDVKDATATLHALEAFQATCGLNGSVCIKKQ
jgi:hypothetical protein